jgi:hypothetical protein
MGRPSNQPSAAITTLAVESSLPQAKPNTDGTFTTTIQHSLHLLPSDSVQPPAPS